MRVVLMLIVTSFAVYMLSGCSEREDGIAIASLKVHSEKEDFGLSLFSPDGKPYNDCTCSENIHINDDRLPEDIWITEELARYYAWSPYSMTKEGDWISFDITEQRQIYLASGTADAYNNIISPKFSPVFKMVRLITPVQSVKFDNAVLRGEVNIRTGAIRPSEIGTLTITAESGSLLESILLPVNEM